LATYWRIRSLASTTWLAFKPECRNRMDAPTKQGRLLDRNERVNRATAVDWTQKAPNLVKKHQRLPGTIRAMGEDSVVRCQRRASSLHSHLAAGWECRTTLGRTCFCTISRSVQEDAFSLLFSFWLFVNCQIADFACFYRLTVGLVERWGIELPFQLNEIPWLLNPFPSFEHTVSDDVDDALCLPRGPSA